MRSFSGRHASEPATHRTSARRGYAVQGRSCLRAVYGMAPTTPAALRYGGSLLSHSSSGLPTALSRERGGLDAAKGRVNQWTEGESALGHNRRQLHAAADGF